MAQIPLTEITFDQFFNGRSGYRAQYYLSEEKGIAYNRDFLDQMVHVIQRAYARSPLKAEWPLVENSMRGQYGKAWVFGEEDAFGNAVENSLSPPRWVENNATSGRRVPLPDHGKIDVKGTFINPSTLEVFIDPFKKLYRASDIHRTGFS